MKKILYICPLNPFDVSSGGHQRTNLICKALSEIGHVDIACFTDKDEYPAKITIENCSIVSFQKRKSYFARVRPKGWDKIASLLKFYSSQSIENKEKIDTAEIKKILSQNDYDYIVVRYLYTAIKCSLKLDNKVIIDIDDFPEQLFRSQMDIKSKSLAEAVFRKTYYFLRAQLAMFHTKRIIRKVNHVFMPIRDQAIYPNSSFLPNIPYPINVKCNNSLSEDEKPHYVAFFVGKLSYLPNISGVEHFLKNIWGDVVKEIPEARFRIAGNGLSEEKKQQWESYKGVEVLGFIPDIIDEYKKCNVVVAPIYQGAGTNIKVLEAMYIEKACIVSEFGSNGFKDILKDNENILIAQNDREFSNKLIKLLKDEDFAGEIAKKASQSIGENYSYESFSKSVHGYIK